MPRTVPIRRSLLLNLTAVVLLLGGGITVLMALTAARTVRSLSSSIIQQASQRTESKLQDFFGSVSSQVVALRAWGGAGLLNVEDPEALEVALKPLLLELPWSESVIVADDLGREFMLRREPAGWSSRQTRRETWGDRMVWREWTDTDPEAVLREAEADYDPRSRPWFLGAVEQFEAAGAPQGGAGSIHWTEPYAFYYSGIPGMTASSAFACMDDRICVVGMDITLLEISRFTAGIQILDDGVVFVMTDDKRLVGVPRGRRGAHDEMAFEPFLLKHPEEIGTPAAYDTAELLAEDASLWMRPVRLDSQGEPWWVQIVPFQLSPQRLLIGVAVEEDDLLGDWRQQRLWLLGITLLALAWAVWRAAVLARGYSRPMEQLVAESQRIAQGDLDGESVVRSRVMEVQRLAEAHDSMRSGLRTLLKLEGDLEVARKIQQATFPRELPRLQGFDLAAWNEPADDTGGDSYDVIGLKTDPNTGELEATTEEAEQAVLLLADATGHGIGPALSVTQLRAMLRMGLRLHEDLSRIAREMNDQLCSDLPRSRFVTAWLGRLDATERTLTTYSAGQAPLVRYVAAEDRFEGLLAQAPPFGLYRGVAAKAPETIVMQPGDIYATISDGIFEAFGSTDEEFGVERVERVIREHHEASAAEILEAIRVATEEFTGGAPASDDRTILLIKCVRGSSRGSS